MIKLIDILKEITLPENIGGGSSIVYHRTKPTSIKPIFEKGFLYPEKSIHWDWYGKGIYTTYDIESQNTMAMIKSYGSYIIKCQVTDYNKILILDYNESKKIYKNKYSFIDQIRTFFPNKNQLVNIFGQNYTDILNKINDEILTSQYTADIAKRLYDEYHIDNYINGMIFTGRNDGRVLVSYITQNIKPLAFVKSDKKITDYNDIKWVSGFNKNLYNASKNKDFTVFEKIVKQLPLTEEEKNIEGDLRLSGTNIPTLPEGLKINGSLFLSDSGVRKFPNEIYIKDNLSLAGCKNLTTISPIKINGNLNTYYSSITTLPPGLQVGGDLRANDSSLKTISKNTKIGGTLYIQVTDVTSLPDDLQAKEIYLNKFKVTDIPKRLKPIILDKTDIIDLLSYLNDNPSEIEKYKSTLEKNVQPIFTHSPKLKFYNLLKNEFILSLMFNFEGSISRDSQDFYFSDNEEDVKELASTGIYNNPLFLKYFNKRYFIEKAVYNVITNPNLYPYYKNILSTYKDTVEEIAKTKFIWRSSIFKDKENISKKSIMALLQKLK
jgi:hypothetical protein